MKPWKDGPMRFGEVLDYTIRIYRHHFLVSFLLVFIFFGFVELVGAVLTSVMGGASMLPDYSGTSWLERVSSGFQPDYSQNVIGFNPIPVIVVYSVLGLIYFLFYPVATAAFMFVIRDIKEGKKPSLGSSIKAAFSRFWALLGSTLLYFLVFLALIPIVILLALIPFPDVVKIVLISILFLVAFAILLFRLSFYLPIVAVERKFPGLSQSWRLTAKNFWRILGIYLVISIIYYVLTTIFSVIVTAIFGASVITQILLTIINYLVYPLLFIVFAIVYFDLKARNEGVDLERMLDEATTQEGSSYINAQDPQPQTDNSETRVTLDT